MSKQLVRLFLSAFQVSLQQTLPSECIKRNLQISNKIDNTSVLVVNNREYPLHHNVHIVAIGKASNGMVDGAEKALGEHFVDGIASAPIDSPRLHNLKTKFHLGAAHNLPDGNSLAAAVEIAEFVKRISHIDDQIILFLVSGGGSALLPAPKDGLTLKDKLAVIRLLAQNGADIKQLNTVRITLSSLKGGKLARLGAPAKMISLIISDIVGDSIDLISSGPTVARNVEPKEASQIFDQLNIADRIPEKVNEVLRQDDLHEISYNICATEADVNNVIIANNILFLETLAKSIRKADATLKVVIVTSTLIGDATAIGVKFADVILTAAAEPKHNVSKNIAREFQVFAQLLPNDEIRPHNEPYTLKQTVFLFGGETTVRFPEHEISPSAKGGRNQELVLAAFQRLSERSASLDNAPANFNFALFSLGTDGQDGPTNAAGAFVTRRDVSIGVDLSELTVHLTNKNSYEFWANRWRDGNNLVRIGKTGTNLMDVQILYVQSG